MNASYKQLALLRRLGVNAPQGLSMQEASAMIDQAQGKTPAPPQRFVSQNNNEQTRNQSIERQVAFKGAIEVALVVIPKPTNPTIEDLDKYRDMLLHFVADLTEAFTEII